MKPFTSLKSVLLATSLCLSNCTGGVGSQVEHATRGNDDGADGTMPVRSVLVRGRLEPQGYGAYSYVLLARSPKDDPRAQALFQEWARLPDATQTARILGQDGRSRLNLSMVPVHRAPPRRADASWYVKEYDVERAAALVLDLRLEDVGPFIVTATAPLTRAQGRSPISVLDLSNAPAESMPLWVEYFIAASRDPEEWRKLGAKRMALKLHDSLASAGAAARSTLSALVDGTILLKAFELGK